MSGTFVYQHFLRTYRKSLSPRHRKSILLSTRNKLSDTKYGFLLTHVDDRFPAKNQVNNRVKTLFRENGIKIAKLKYVVNVN